MEMKLSEVVFRDDLYPRLETNPTVVQTYSETIDVLPPIEVNQRNELIDGWHRWTAHKKAKRETIAVTVTQTSSDAELLELAISRNAQFGLQLSREDKREMARRIYHITPEKDRTDKKKYLAKILSVGYSTVQDWLSRIDKDAKEAQRKRIFDLWLSCHTQQEIADAEGMDRTVVTKLLCDFPVLENCTKPTKAAAEHATDFEPPIYNIWKQQTKSSGSSHFGNSEVRWVDNLLYLYTNPFDVVVDPFAGGGSTIDICKKRLRRYLVSDRKPIIEREHEIVSHDVVTDGLRKPPNWKDVKLVYLDPPYWKQAEGKYSKDKTDLANMTLDDFTSTLSALIKSYYAKLQKDAKGAAIALIMSPTQWSSNKDHDYKDHVTDVIRAVNKTVDMRYSVPYESQQYTPQMVEWAKENRKTLVLTREIVVWRIPSK